MVGLPARLKDYWTLGCLGRGELQRGEMGSVSEKFGGFVVTGLRVWHLEVGEGRVRYQESKIRRLFYVGKSERRPVLDQNEREQSGSPGAGAGLPLLDSLDRFPRQLWIVRAHTLLQGPFPAARQDTSEVSCSG